jgi:hypothetical protein
MSGQTASAHDLRSVFAGCTMVAGTTPRPRLADSPALTRAVAQAMAEEFASRRAAYDHLVQGFVVDLDEVAGLLAQA